MTKRIQISALTYVHTYVFYNGQIFLSSVYTHTHIERMYAKTFRVSRKIRLYKQF